MTKPPSRIVTARKPKRAPPKRKQQPASTAAIVTPGKSTAGNDNRPAKPAQPTTIVTTRKSKGSPSDVPDMTPEEHQRRGDAAEALWREMVRAAGKKSP